VVYIERTPAPPLKQYVRALWYNQNAQPQCRRERMLPSGCVQVILNLARDFLLDCPEGRPPNSLPPSLVVGARSVFEVVDTSDMAELIGIVFMPGGFSPFARDAVDLFSNQSISLEGIWGGSARTLRDRLREVPGPDARLRHLEEFLLNRFVSRLPYANSPRHAMVDYALTQFERAPLVSSVRSVARYTGWSERYFSQVFREQVGLSPKVWTRVQRFQRAVKQLHAGLDLPWSEIALDCGYYDQSHFANEFRAFSGIDATTYTARHTRWANHVSAD
jgi:AraC-like DNA-binding protein